MRSWGKAAGVVAVVIGVLAGLATPADAAPVGYSTTPLAGWSTNGTVWRVLVVGDTVYAGGEFTQVRGPGGSPTLNRTNLAAFDLATGAIRTGFSADTNGAVRALATDGTRLYVGGDFTNIKGAARNRLAAVNPTSGNVDGGFTANATSTVFDLERHGDRLYVGGAFTTIKSVARGRIAALDPVTGAVDPVFNPGASNQVRAIEVSPDGSRVYVGGLYTSIGGTNRPYLVAVTSTTGSVLPVSFFRSTEARVIDLDLSPSGNELFGALGDLENRVTAWNTGTGNRLWWHPADGDVQAVKYQGGNLYYSFHEGAFGNTSLRLLAADALSGELTPYQPAINTFFAVHAIDAAPGALVIGGEFTIVGGVQTRGIAILPFQPSETVPPSPPTNLRVTDTSGSTVSLAWDPGTDNIAVYGYRVLRDGVEVGSTTATSFTDIDLPAESEHEYTVVTVDTAGNVSPPSAAITAGTDFTLVPARSTWRYLDNGSDQGTAWRAPGFDDGGWAQGPAELGYGDGDEATVVSFGPNATLKPLTTYFRHTFQVANPATVGQMTLRVLRDDGAVVYLNGTEVARTNMPTGTITSTTIAAATADGAAEDTFFPFTVNPSLLVTGANTLAVEIHQRSRNSSDISFDLSLDADRQSAPPAPAAPTGLQATGTTGTTIDLAWSAPAGTIAGYRVYRNGVLVGSPTATSFPDTGLQSGVSYTYTVTARNASDVESAPTAPLVVATQDVVPPGPPTGLATTTVAGNLVALTWTAPTDNVGVTGYEVRRDGALVGSPASASFSDTTVVSQTGYSYTVRARDAAGNWSAESDPLAVTTPEVTSDITPPSPPANLTATRGATTAVLSWTASTDDTGVDHYVVTRNGVAIGTTTGTTFPDGLLNPSTAYTYRVVAWDAALNSAESAPLVVTTHAATETVFARNTAWRYTEDGIERGTAWKEPGYDDTAWPTGNGQLGYFDGDEATVMFNGGTVNSEKFISHYLRRTFTVTDPAHVTGLTLSLLRDDGAVVYVNGAEVFRTNMPAGTITSRTFANVAVSGAAENAYTDFAIPPSLLVAGTNTIAVSVHNNSRSGNSDLGFDAGLVATFG
jgi:chitodextrinase